MQKTINKLEKYRAEVLTLEFNNHHDLDKLLHSIAREAKKEFGKKTKYVKKVHGIQFYPYALVQYDDEKIWDRGKDKLTLVINEIIENLKKQI